MKAVTFTLTASFRVIAASLASAQCTSGIELCYLSLEPFSSNAFVFTEICSICESKQSILIGLGCVEVGGAW